MTAEHVELIEPERRNRVYGEIRRIVREVGAVDTALERIGEDGALIDEALQQIAELLGSEIVRARKRSRRMKVA